MIFKVGFGVFLCFLLLGCNAETPKKEPYKLSISPNIDTTTNTSKVILTALEKFLKTKDSSLTENLYWKKADFKKFVFPYIDLYQIEAGKLGKHYYQPTLMELQPLADMPGQMLKIGFVGHNDLTGNTNIKAIYNLIAEEHNDSVIFSNYLNYSIHNWQQVTKPAIKYYIAPDRKMNVAEIAQQEEDIIRLQAFFEITLPQITYVSCTNVKQLFVTKGFDYHPMMYTETKGGMAGYGNFIFSAINSELYTHEIVHLFTKAKFNVRNSLLDEGIATLLAGSSGHAYAWHKQQLKTYLASHPDFDFMQYTDVYAKQYIADETSIPYMTGALICETLLYEQGKQTLFSLLETDGNLWDMLNESGITKANFNEKLEKALSLPPANYL